MKRFKIQENLSGDFSVSVIQDENGNVMQVTDAKKDDLPSKLIVKLEATHTGVNRNHVEYTHAGLEASTDSWTKDYNKPVLLNHNTHSDPLGRVVASEYKQSIIDASKNCIVLTLEITNSAAIERFLDGRYKTFSIGGYADSAVCNICGKDQMKDGWCGHSRGRKYGDQSCYWTLGQMDYDEVSVVNCPADPSAQAISIDFVDENGETKPVAEPTQEPVNNGSEEPIVTDGTTLAHIDSLLGVATGEPNEPPAQEPQIDYVAEIEALNLTIATHQSDAIAQQELITQLTEENKALKDSSEAIQTKLEDAESKSNALIQQNVNLAKLTHKIMCNRAVDIQIALGDAKEEDREQMLLDYASFTSQKLEDLTRELLEVKKSSKKVPVPHPGTAQTDSTTTEKAGGQSDSKEPTLDEYVANVTKFFVSKM